MGTISEKLTYLNNTKSKIKDVINMTGANIDNNTTFRNYATQLKEGYIDILNNGTDTLYNNFTHLTGKGMTLSFAPTYQAPMKITCYGSTSQASTPTPSSPVDVVNTTGNQSIEICKTNLAYTDWASNFVSRINDNTKAKLETKDTRSCLWYAKNAGYGEYDTKYMFKRKWKENTQYTFAFDIFCVDTVYCNLDIEYTDGTVTELLVGNDDMSVWTHKVATSTSGKTIKYLKPRWRNNSCYIDINTFMVYEGTDTTTPYEAYNGTNYNIGLTSKNLFDNTQVIGGYRLSSAGKNYSAAGYYISPFIKVEPNTTYTKNSPTIDAYHRIAFYTNNNENDYISVEDSLNTVTTPSTCNYVRFCGEVNEMSTAQLEKGSSSTNYVDYFTPIELCKIGDYEDKIDKSTGKNLFDKDNLTSKQNYVKNDSGAETSTQGFSYTTSYTNVKPNTQYTLSGDLVNSSGTVRVYYYNANKEWISRSSGFGANVNVCTFTTPNNCYYIQFQYINSVFNANTIIINKGSTALPYEPYGTYWYLKKNIGKVVLDGSESYTNKNVTDNNLLFLSNVIDGLFNTSALTNILSNNFRVVNSLWDTDAQGTLLFNSIYGLRMRIDKTLLSNVSTAENAISSFKTWLSTHNTDVYYILSTPTYTKITDSTLIEQLEAIKSKDNTTNITSSMVIGAIALKKE